MTILHRLALSAAILAGPCLAEAFALEYYMRNPQQAAGARNGNGVSNVAPSSGTSPSPTDEPAQQQPTSPSPQPQPTMTGCSLNFTKAAVDYSTPVAVNRITMSGRHSGASNTPRPMHTDLTVYVDSGHQVFSIPLTGDPTGTVTGTLDLPSSMVGDVFIVSTWTGLDGGNLNFTSIRLAGPNNPESGC